MSTHSLLLRLVRAMLKPGRGKHDAAAALEAVAKTGDAEAQYQLGHAYLTGRGAPGHPTVAATWLSRAALQGHAAACHDLSLIYLNGAQARTPAAIWAREATERGANDNVALLYPEGFDVAPHPEKAFGLAQAAAQTGLACAQANLAMLYLQGIGCVQDFGEAERWFRRAAQQNDAGGALGLGILHEHGLGVAANLTEAARWYHIAAEQDNDAAATALGLLTLAGHGVARNLPEAQRLLAGPAKRGNDFARKGLAKLTLAATNDRLTNAGSPTMAMNS